MRCERDNIFHLREETQPMIIKAKRSKGFTLIELVMVIALLGVLAIVAIPTYQSISTQSAAVNARNAVVSAVQTALSNKAAQDVAAGNAIAYPANLDGISAGFPVTASIANPMFNDPSILKNGVVSGWRKLSAQCYESNAESPVKTFSYTSASGTFVSPGTPCT